MRKDFYTIFGEDILTKEFDADMYKGGAYIEVMGDIAYIIEVSWECDTLRLVKLSNVSPESLIDLLIEKTDDFYTIGAGYYNQEVCDLIYETYQCSHPIFGDKPFEVNPEDAYKKGLEVGNKLK